MLSKIRRNKDDQYVSPEDALKIKDYEDNNHTSSYLPLDKFLFSEKDDTRLTREKCVRDQLQTLSNYHPGPQYKSTAQMLFPVKEIYALPKSYKSAASKNSRRSCMSLVAKMADNNIYPTTAALDPYFRSAVLGKYIDANEEEDDSSEEIPRGLHRPRGLFHLKPELRTPGLINQVTEESYGEWKADMEGRNVVSVLEYGLLKERFSKLELVQIPMEEISDSELTDIILELLKNTTGPYQLPQDKSRAEKEEIMGKLLSCLKFPEKAWSQAIWLCCSVGAHWTRKANVTDGAVSTNIYSTPVYCDLSVVNMYWSRAPGEIAEGESKSQVPLSRLKRSIADCTVYESETKHQKQTIKDLEDGISKLNSIAGQILTQRGLSMKNILLEEHAELAEDLLGQLQTVQVQSDRELEKIKQEITHVKQQLDHSRRLTGSYEIDQEELQDTLNKVEQEKAELEGRLKEISDQGGVAPESKIAELNAQQEQLVSDLQKKAIVIDQLKQENEELQQKFAKLNNAMNESLEIKQSASAMDISLTNSVKKSQRKFSKISTSPIVGELLNPGFISDSEDESDDFKTPDRTLAKPKSTSIAAMTLTPSKIGLKAWSPEVMNFSQWFSQSRMQIEAATALSDNNEKAVIRLILMCLPHKYSWVQNMIADDSTIDTVSKAKAKIIKLLYNDRGMIDDFNKISIRSGEHPLTFLERMATNLEATEDMNSKFLLRTVEEKLEKNLDRQTFIELQRLISKERSTLTFEKIKVALQEAIRLTGGNNDQDNGKEEILSAISALRRNINRCYHCNSPEHIASQCYKQKNGKNYKNFQRPREGFQREHKDKKDGSLCFFCKKPGHWKKDCKFIRKSYQGKKGFQKKQNARK